MRKVSDLIYKGLTEGAEMQNVFGGRVFPLIAPSTTALPFVRFFVRMVQPEYTKDSKQHFLVIVENYGTNYENALAEAELVNEAIKEVIGADAVRYHFREEEKAPQLAEDLKTVYVEQLYTIKK